MKSEPSVFSFDDLKKASRKTTSWEGVRNYQARNFMRDRIKKDDWVLFYHSNCAVIGVVGLAQVVRESYPDHTAWDPESKYFDPKSTPENPRWFMVDLQYRKEFKQTITLEQLKQEPTLTTMKVVQKGQRLSVQPVTAQEFKKVCAMGGVKP